jgi:hypothetical protein
MLFNVMYIVTRGLVVTDNEAKTSLFKEHKTFLLRALDIPEF